MIRQYKETDLNDLLDAWYSASQVGHPFLGNDFLQQERRNIVELYLPNAETWIYEFDGKVVGFISLIGNEVGGLFVNANFHRQGIGRALLDHAKSIRDSLELDVFEDNIIGREFYEKAGFTRVAQHVDSETGFTQLRLRLIC